MFASLDPLRLISVQNIIRNPLPSVVWIVQPIVAQGERVLLYGEFGALKSWLLLHMGLHIACGRSWLGEFTVTKPRSVLYVDEEMTEHTIRLRIKQLVAGEKIPTDDMQFQVASREGVLLTEMGGKVLLERVWKADYRPEVVIIDSMRATLVGSENEQEDVIAFWRAIEPILKAGITVIVTHHMRKPREEGLDSVRYRASGSTAIISGSDSAWAVTRHGQAPIATVEAIRIRLAKEPPPFTVEFTFDGEEGPVRAIRGLPPEEVSSGGKAIGIILDRLGAGPTTTTDLRAACEAEGVPVRTFERALASLETQGRIVKSGGQRGEWILATQCD